jgi:hypothetical protein
MFGLDILKKSPEQSKKIDSGMILKILVLKLNETGLEFVGYRIVGWESPLTIRGNPCSK